jgi:hypothetical protein
VPNAIDLPAELEEVREAISCLVGRGWQICGHKYDKQAFGNWYIDFCRQSQTIRLVKDRSQYFVEGTAEKLKTAGLWRAFNEVEEFQRAVIAWVENLEDTTVARP